RTNERILQQRPSRARRTEAVRPELVLDPWSPFGPELQLPPIQFDAVAEWRLWSARGVEDVATSSFDTKHVCLPPAKVWHLELRRHGEPTREWSFEGFDSSPAIFFNTSG